LERAPEARSYHELLSNDECRQQLATARLLLQSRRSQQRWHGIFRAMSGFVVRVTHIHCARHWRQRKCRHRSRNFSTVEGNMAFMLASLIAHERDHIGYTVHA